MIQRWATGFTNPSGAPTEKSCVVYSPRVSKSAPGKGRLISLHHGYGGDGSSPILYTGWYEMTRVLCELGFVVLGTDCGGQLWGSDTSVARSLDLYNWALANAPVPNSESRGSSKILSMGASMGNGSAMNFANQHQAISAGVVGFWPLANLDNFYASAGGSAQASIDAAFGGSYAVNGHAHSPHRLAVILGALSPAIPAWFYYSTGDAVIAPADVVAMGAAYGSEATLIQIPGAPPHVQFAQNGIDFNALVAQILSADW